jgi:arylsulfatase A
VPKPGEEPAAPPFRLFNLKDDSAEKDNVAATNLEIVQRLQTILKRYVKNGRSTPGPVQTNTPAKKWPGLEWMSQNRQ